MGVTSSVNQTTHGDCKCRWVGFKTVNQLCQRESGFGTIREKGSTGNCALYLLNASAIMVSY